MNPKGRMTMTPPCRSSSNSNTTTRLSLSLVWLLSLCSTPTESLLIRSQGSGGLATGLAYNVRDDHAVVVGTTFAKSSFWNMKAANQQGECFVAVGQASAATENNFARLAIAWNDQPELPAAICFGGSATLEDDNQGGLGVASLLGMRLPASSSSSTTSSTGFVHSVLYYLGQVQLTSDAPVELPVDLLPVASTKSIGEAAEIFVGLHRISDSAVFADQKYPLKSLMQFWWQSTYPPNLDLLLADGQSRPPLTLAAPHIRKQDLFTGILSYDISLGETGTDGATSSSSSTALIAALALPQKLGETSLPPLIVVGSTNGPDASNSLFGQNSAPKSDDKTDFDGYILFLDPETGAIFGSSQDTNNAHPHQMPIRINSIGDADDYLQGICVSPDQRYFYVVGTTQGILQGIHKGGAFVIKYDMTDILNGGGNTTAAVTMEWQYQVSGVNVQGLTCTADADAVYLGGSTESDLWTSTVAGGNNVQPTLSPDAFVTKLAASTGQVQWTKPLDTTLQENGDKRREVIVGMEMTTAGKVLVLMNSMNLQTGQNDVFLLDLDPTTGSNDLYSALYDGNIQIPDFGSSNKDSDEKDQTVVILATVIPVSVALLLFGVTFWRHRTDVERLPKHVQKDYKEADEKHEASAPPAVDTALSNGSHDEPQGAELL